MKNWKGVIFDLDGTVLDSMWVWDDVDADFLAARGIVMPEDYIATITPMGFERAADYTKERFGLKESREEILEEWFHMAVETYRTSVPCKKGAKEFLSFLRDAGIPCAVATASHPALYRPALEHNGILDCFAAFVSAAEVSRGKDFPDVYLLAAERIGVEPSSCLVFEDILLGIRGAKAGGFTTVGVAEASSAKNREAIREEADWFIEAFWEMQGIFPGWGG